MKRDRKSERVTVKESEAEGGREAVQYQDACRDLFSARTEAGSVSESVPLGE